MIRTYVVTGAASGIGKAAASILSNVGHKVIGIDLRDVDVCADLASEKGRAKAVEMVEQISGGIIDGLLCSAGLASDTLATAKVNYFGTVAVLNGLRPLLARSPAPRAVVVASMAVLFPHDEELLHAFEAGDEERALRRAENLTVTRGAIYCTSKKAVARWARRQAPTPEWAGSGIALNIAAPGVVMTPMMADALKTEEDRAAVLKRVPMPLNGIASAKDVAAVLVWLSDVENTHVTGQVIFVDGGADAVIRGVASV